MEWTIYSIGESAFLEQIFNGVAMITGSGDFIQIVSIGLLVGVLIIGWQALVSGAKGGVDFQQALIGVVIYMMLFAPKVTVVIEDAYSGAVRPVDNVPLIAGAVGGTISKLGYGLTRLFEVGYGTIIPGVTETHFADALKSINDIRRKVSEPKVFQAINQALGDQSVANMQSGTSTGTVNFRRSWYNYIKECTLKGIDTNRFTLDALMTHSAVEAMQYKSTIHHTLLFLDAGNPFGTTMTCSAAYTLLMERTQAAFASESVKNAMAESAGIVLYDDQDLYTKLSENFGSLATGGAAAVDAQKYVMAAVLDNVYLQAAQGRYQDMRDFSSATMIGQALMQRNTQWASEQSMFRTTVRPMLALIEGFVYAIVPFMGFLMVIGRYGQSLVGKYFQMLIWIQLWMPVLSIINLYLYSAATQDLESLMGVTSGTAIALDSFYGLYKSDEYLANWLATGGMLAAATPVLTMMLVTGSTYAWTSLAQRMNGADHINEKITTPDVVSNSPALNNLAMNSNTNVGGTAGTGADSLLPNLAFDARLSSAASSAQSYANDKREQFTRTLSNSFTDNVSQQQMTSLSEQIGRTVMSSNSSEAQAIRSAAASYMRDHNIGASQTAAVTGLVTMAAAGGASLSLSLPTKGKGKGGDTDSKDSSGINGGTTISGQMNDSDSNQVQFSKADGDKYLKQAGFSESSRASLSDALSHGISSMSTQTLSHALGSERARSLQNAASEAVSANETYARTSSLAESFGSNTGLTINDLANQMSQNDGAARMLTEFAQYHPELRSKVSKLMDRYTSNDGPYRMDERKARVAASLVLMTDERTFGNDNSTYLSSMSTVAKATGMTLGRDLQGAPEMSHEANAGLVDRAAGIPGGIREEAERIQGPAMVNRDQAAAGAAAGPSYTQGMGRLNGNNGPVGQHHEAGLSEARSQGSSWGGELQTGRMKNAAESVLQAPEPPAAYTTTGTSQTTEALVNTAAASATGMAKDMTQKAIQWLSGMDDQQLKQFSDAAQSGEDLSHFQLPDGLKGAGLKLSGLLAKGMMGGEVVDTMSNEEAAAVYAGQLAEASKGKGGRVGEAALSRSGELMRERMYEAARSDGLTESMANHYADQFTTANQAIQLAEQLGDIPIPSPLLKVAGLVGNHMDHVNNGELRSERIAEDKQAIATARGYERFENLPQKDQELFSKALDRSYDYIEAAPTNRELASSLLQHPARLASTFNPTDITKE
ncbi:conjugal transfer mating pair stabilization protein TraG [Pseudomonas duriflava]|uniref:Conjugal transfer mating pair stabilization protein TraG n=1 Tax=Pseudomonas duriflava TaxID=459528 RepID=A0A562PYQ9_9PSED|nr:conjugal transfer protein TraG N-terminal domain-containing protein [Pseudomonas duriflava]TWI49592.1 conjugal transfer mating pair stabilization protein TraG [Pseudomonas duriflava]